jgi:hypothetical protein
MGHGKQPFVGLPVAEPGTQARGKVANVRPFTGLWPRQAFNSQDEPRPDGDRPRDRTVDLEPQREDASPE